MKKNSALNLCFYCDQELIGVTLNSKVKKYLKMAYNSHFLSLGNLWTRKSRVVFFRHSIIKNISIKPFIHSKIFINIREKKHHQYIFFKRTPRKKNKRDVQKV